MNAINKVSCLALSTFLVLGLFFAVTAAEDDQVSHGNVVSVISESSDGIYKIRSTLQNIDSSEGGKWIYTAELLNEAPSVDRIQIQIKRESSAKNDFKFSSSDTAQGLFSSTGTYSVDELASMVIEGSAKVKNPTFIAITASTITFDTGFANQYPGGLEFTSDYPQTLFSCEFPINPNYDSKYKDWKNGFDNALTISTVMIEGTTRIGTCTSPVFSVPPANSEDSSDSNEYTAALSAPTDTIASDGTFDADVIITSSQALACGQLNLTCENGTIESIAQGSGLTLADDGSFEGTADSGVLSFYGNTASAADGLTVATVTVKADGSGKDVVLSIDDGVAGASGSVGEVAVTTEEATKSVTVPVLSNDLVSCETYAGGKYIVKYTGDVPDGSVAQYNGTAMFWSEKYSAWAALSDTDVSETVKNSDVAVVSGTKAEVVYDGDVNGNGKVNIVDAQIAYDIANSVYPNFDIATLAMWFKADVNGNSLVDALDARAIQVYLHTGDWNKQIEGA